MKRLVLCLDGTWNDQDDSTNVGHIANLVRKGEVGPAEARVLQRVFYRPGVGTGALDHLTGGGFGFGLEKNVRAAYDWLIEHYEDGDHVFVFGFSRGAYTARSLVGFLATCGLLRRGAPLTVNQLWQGYCILGRQKEERQSWWEDLAGRRAPPFRPLHELGEAGPANATEALLLRYSRRIPIHYLGVFDTVGAMGWDALAIPGLRSRLALQHNLRPTRLIERCRHALAIDENRSSFRHTPFVDYMSGSEPEWESRSLERAQRIRQRWFVGAHSNVGGGYPDNDVALRPLEWMLEGAREQGLELEPLQELPALRAPALTDSYAQFAAPLWEHVLRAKRNYRRIAPPIEVRSGRHGGEPFSLDSVGEEVDPSVVEYARAAHSAAAADPVLSEYAPPALVAYARQNGGELEPLARTTDCRHRWLGESVFAILALAAWATIAAQGSAVLGIWFELKAPVWSFSLLAALWVVHDWAESRLAFGLALNPEQARERAIYDALFWIRIVGVVSLVAGGVAIAARLFWIGWNASTPAELAPAELRDSWWVPLSAGLTLALLGTFEARGSRARARPWLALLNPLLLGLLGGLVLLMGQLAALVLRHEPSRAAAIDAPGSLALAGGLLALELAALALARGLDWVGGPMQRVNLGSIIKLQFTLRPSKVLAYWRSRLSLERGRPQDVGAAPATQRLGQALGGALWRDIVGLVPLYSLVFALAASFLGQLASAHLEGWRVPGARLWSWLDEPAALGLRPWLMLVLATALADWLEDALHLSHLRRFARGQSSLLAPLGLMASILKLAGFLLGCVLLVSALALGAWTLAVHGRPGWRTTLALLGALSLAPVICLWLVSLLMGQLRRFKKAAT